MSTRKLYDLDAYQTEFEAIVVSCEKIEIEEKCVDFKPQSEVYKVVLDQTLFFPEEGGQTPDKGYIEDALVFDVQIKNETIAHYVTKPFEVNQPVKGKIDWKKRFSNMQQHSAEHIFSGMVHKKYGMQNVGFHLSDQIVTMDFDKPLTEEQVKELEWEINLAITANVEVKTGYPAKEELANLDYRSKIALDGDIRIVEISGYDICACCAPHVRRTGEIGIFKIQSTQNYKGGIRISFLSGFRALEEYRRKSEIISELSGILTTNQDNLSDHVQKLKSQITSLKGQLANASQLLMERKLRDIPSGQKDVILFERELEVPVMRSVVNKLVEMHEGICAIFVGSDENGYHFILGSANADCREFATKLRVSLNARGGGSAQMVQGSLSATADEIRACLLE